MISYFGDFPEDATVYIPFNTFSSDDPTASVTVTDLVDADIKVHKDGGTTEIATDGATISINFDSITGNHLITIDTSAHSDYATGSDYLVRIEGVTVDGGTINAFVGSFSIENRFNQTVVPDAAGIAATQAEVATECADALTDIKLDHLIHTAAAEDEVADNSVIARLASTEGDWSEFNDETDSLEAISVKADLLATAEALAAISATSGGTLNYSVTDDNVDGPLNSITFVGTQDSGTFTDTETENDTYHTIGDTGDAIDIVYQFNLGGNRTASEIDFLGYLTGLNDAINIQAYDHVGSDWETIFVLSGTSAVNQNKVIPIFAKHTSTTGIVYIRFVCTGQSSPTLNIDRLIIGAVNTFQSVGYSGGAIWVKATGTAGSVAYVNGTADNPCPWANALVISATLGITRFNIINGETITLTTACINKSLSGNNWNLALGGQDISSSQFTGAKVSGIAAPSSDGQPIFDYCGIGAVTMPGCRLYQCGLGRASGTFTAAVETSKQYNFIDCFSMVPGSDAPVFDFSGGTTSRGINIRRFSGSTNITLDSICTMSLEVIAGGGQTVAVGAASEVEIRGICKAITLTGITAASTIQIDGMTGPVSLAGADGTVNIYGICGTVTDNRTGTPLGTVEADINLDVTAILADTNELQTDDVPGLISALDTVVDRIETDTQDIQTQIGTAGDGLTNITLAGDLSATMKTSINAEVDTALNTAIPATPTADSINEYIQKMKYVMLNKTTVTKATGTSVILKDNDSDIYATVVGAYAEDATTVIRLRLE